MSETIRIKRGLDIPLAGKAAGASRPDPGIRLFAIVPDDYPGMVWKAVVKPGDRVACGDPLLADKETGTVCLASPVAGTVAEVHRGERRHIEFISVERDGDALHDFGKAADRDSALAMIQSSGLWAMMRQRPYDIVPLPGVTPRDIFVTAFDSAPLAPGMECELTGRWLEKGLEWLSRLTDGKVYLGIRPGQDIATKAAVATVFDGPHPAGNAGTQIAAVKPVNKGETVWTLDAVTAARIGKLCETGKPDCSTRVALTGPVLKDPHTVETQFGASMAELLAGLAGSDDIRIISGNVLTGTRVSLEGFLRYPYRQVTVMEEGAHADEFMGWASMSPAKFSVKRSFPAFLRGLSKPFAFDARIKGGRRAMILSGELDSVFPFDILPEYLLKAILARDIERMEKLGIYEVAPEDFALAEFVDTSKNELQRTVREGLDYLRKELS